MIHAVELVRIHLWQLVVWFLRPGFVQDWACSSTCSWQRSWAQSRSTSSITGSAMPRPHPLSALSRLSLRRWMLWSSSLEMTKPHGALSEPVWEERSHGPSSSWPSAMRYPSVVCTLASSITGRTNHLSLVQVIIFFLELYVTRTVYGTECRGVSAGFPPEQMLHPTNARSDVLLR